MKLNTKKEIISFAISLIAIVIFIALTSVLLTPKRTDFGSTWGSYLQEEQDTIDVMFFGSSITYCDVVPSVIYNESGIASYVMAGPEQTVPIMYYYIKECEKTQSPKVIFIEITGVFFEQYQNYTKVNIGMMPYGTNRIAATLEAAEPSEAMGLFFPLYNYHSRWETITEQDIKYTFSGYNADKLAGYTFLNAEEKDLKATPRGEVIDEENYTRNINYINKIALFCKDNDITPVFYIAPTQFPLSKNSLQRLENDINSIDGTGFFDFNSEKYVMGIDTEKDYYDLLHFNCQGAEKFSVFLGEFLADELDLDRTEALDAEMWSERYEYFKELVDAG